MFCFHKLTEQKGFGYVCLLCSDYSVTYRDKIKELNSYLDITNKELTALINFMFEHSENGLWLDQVEDYVLGMNERLNHEE